MTRAATIPTAPPAVAPTDRRVGALVRIMRVETCDHPLVGDAVPMEAERLAEVDWADPVARRRAADRFADGIEDRVAYAGQPLDLFIAEPWLSRWRGTCLRAILRDYGVDQTITGRR